MGNQEIAMRAAHVLSNKKGQDVVIIDIAQKSSFADYLVVASGGSERQVAALASEVEDQLAKDGVIAKNVEGKSPSGWVLLDYGDVIVNIFSAEQRERYNIEKIWGDGIFLNVE